MTPPQLSVICSLYKSEEYLKSFLQNFRQQSLFEASELILVHNEPSQKELEIIQNFAVDAAVRINHVKLPAVESLGSSWNRAWNLANGKFIAIWNVDDRRESDSLRQQVEVLNQEAEVVAVYGDYFQVKSFNSKIGVKRVTPPFSKSTFLRSFPQGGAFAVYRKDLAQKIGYFDEQLSVGPDMEFSFRIAACGLNMARVPDALGYFTNEEKGLSTRGAGKAAALDRAAIYLRYAVYDKIDTTLLSELKGFREDQLLVNGKWISLKSFWPGIENYRDSRGYLWSVGKIRSKFRSLLIRLGLLDALHAVQRRITHRDL